MNRTVIALITLLPTLLCAVPEYAIGHISNESAEGLVIIGDAGTRATLSAGQLKYLNLEGIYGVGCTIFKRNSRHDRIYVHCIQSNNAIHVTGIEAEKLDQGQTWAPEDGFFQYTEKIEDLEGAHYTVNIAVKDSTLRKLECIIVRTK